MTASGQVPAAPGAADWLDPGAFDVAPGVHRIPLPMPNDALRAVNVYAIEAGDGFVLVDGGWAIDAAYKQLRESLRELGAELQDIRRILVTHAHRDHYTLGVLLRREFGTPLSLGDGERPTLAVLTRPGRRRYGGQMDILRRAGATDLAQQLSADNDQVDPVPDGWEDPDVWLHAGTIDLPDRELRVLATPGHTRGHVVFLDAAAGLLFSGDHILPHITPSIGFEPVPAPLPLQDYLASLRLVRELPDTRMMPAHGPVAESVHARIDELIDHHDHRLAECVRIAAAAGGCHGIDVASTLRWTRHGRSFDELDSFNQLLAVTETMAHLDLLLSAGRLTSDGADVPTYRMANRAEASWPTN